MENPEQKSVAALAYAEMSVHEPELPGDDDLEGGQERATASEGAMSPNPSDMAIADKRLFPTTGYDYLDMLMVAENFPENFNAVESAIIKHLLLQNEEMAYVQARAIAHTAMSIGFTREGRMDAIQIAGASASQKKDSDKAVI